MKFRPDIRPPMWGPPEAVLYAVRVNAERIGAPPPTDIFAMWEGAGLKIYDYVTLRASGNMPSNFTWNNGVLTGSDSATAQLDLPREGAKDHLLYYGDWAIIVAARLTTASNSYTQGLFEDVSISGTDVYCTRPAYTNDLRFQIRVAWADRGTAVVSNGALLGTPFVVGAKSENATTRKIYYNSVLAASNEAAVALNTNTTRRILGGTGTTRTWGGEIYWLFEWRGVKVPDDAMIRLTDPGQMYQLLMPVVRPWFIDLGAGGQTFYSSVGGGTVGLGGTLDEAVTVALPVGGGAVGSVGALARLIGFGVGKGSLGLGGTLARSTMRGVGGGSVSPAGSVSTALEIIPEDVGGGTLSPVGALLSSLIHSISVGSGLLGPVGTLVKQVGRGVGAGIVGPVGDVVKRAARTVGAGIVGLAGAVGSVLNPEIPVVSWAGKVFGGGLKKIMGGRRRQQ